MKKLALCLVCLLLALSCSFNAPQSITIKGSPELRLTLGSPFKEGEGLADHIGIEKIREMMNKDPDANKGIYIEHYLGDQLGTGFENVQTYLVHYPIIEMTLNLDEYLETAFEDIPESHRFTVPSNVGSEYAFSPHTPYNEYYIIQGIPRPGSDPGIPLFRIPLDDMAKLVVSVEGKAFGIKIPWSQSFEDYLWIKVPAFGINDYIQGTEVQDGDESYLEFVNASKKQFIPADDLTPDLYLEIFAKVTGPCSGTIAVEPIFDWEKAVIDTTSGEGTDALHDEYEISNSLGDFLGVAEFSKVQSYFYVSGLDGGEAKLHLYYDDGHGINDLVQNESLIDSSFNPDLILNNNLPGHSISSPPYIDLTDVLNSPNDINLGYNIEIERYVIVNEPGQNITIKADLVLLLPMSLKIFTPPKNPVTYGNYVKLDLGDAFGDLSDEDLFRRKSDGDLINLDSVTIFLDNPRITAIDPLRLAVLITTSGGFEQLLDFGSPRPSLTIQKQDLAYPFAPQFEVLFEKELPAEAFATLEIERDARESWKMDFELTITAKVGIDKTIDL